MTTTTPLTRRRLRTIAKHDWFLGMDGRQIFYGFPASFLILFEVFIWGSLGLLMAIPTTAGAIYVVYGRRNGEAVVDLLPQVVLHWWWRVRGHNTWDNPAAGFILNVDTGKAYIPRFKLPRMIGNLSTLAYQTRTGEVIGINVDSGTTYTSSIAVTSRDFITLPFGDQDDLLSKWGQIVGRRASEGSPVSRVTCIVRTIAEDPEAHAQYLRENARSDFFDDERTLGYRAAMSRGDDSPEFETTVNVTIDRVKAARKIKRAGGGHLGACRVLEAEIEALGREILQQLNVIEVGWVLHDTFCDDMRLVYEPYERPNVLKLDSSAPRTLRDALPMRLDNSDPHYLATGRSLHRVYRVQRFPLQDLPPDYAYDFLADRLGPKAIALVMELVPNTKASRQLMTAAVNDDAVVRAREDTGRRVRAATREQLDQTESTEQELVDGHRLVRFEMYATIGGCNLDELDDNAGELEALFADSSIDIRPLTRQHGPALSFFLPGGRGVKAMNALGIS